MEALAESQSLQIWLVQYGSFALFFLLVFGILALPIPEETLMVVAGVLMHHGELEIPATIAAALLGSMCGISSSYLLGRTAGLFLIHRYGRWVGIGQRQIDRGHAWFERFGKWSLIFGYFIPGVRHFTGVFAGVAELSFSHFALFAYTGAFIWVSCFLSIGYFFGSYWLLFFEKIEVEVDDLLTLGIAAAILIALYWLAKKVRKKHKND